jgi:hypothetical protein
MRSGEDRVRQSDIVITRAPAMSDVLVDVLAGASESPPQLFEALYYAAEDDLMALMRLIAALDPDDRAKIHEHAKAMHGARQRSGSP